MKPFFRNRQAWLWLLILGICLPITATFIFFLIPQINTVTFDSFAYGVPLEYLIYGLVIGIPVCLFSILFTVALVGIVKKKEWDFPRRRSRVWQTFLLIWVIFFGLYCTLFLADIPKAINVETIMLPMSDGARLNTAIYSRDWNARPVILVRTPYGGILSKSMVAPLVNEGFNVVIQDCRGTPPAVPPLTNGHFSEGNFVPFIYDIMDGNDTINWIATQPWCNGKVLMDGESYLAWTQFAAALARPKALVAITPVVFGSTAYDAAYCNGMVQQYLGSLWFLLMTGCGNTSINPLGDFKPPLSAIAVPSCNVLSYWNQILNHSLPDSTWQLNGVLQGMDRIQVPEFHEIGYFDFFAWTGIQDFKELGKRNDFTANHSILVIAPHGHGPVPQSLINAEPLAKYDPSKDINAYLVNASKGIFPSRQVRAFIVGANEWINGTTWPFPGTTNTTVYLHENHVLNTTAPVKVEADDTYLYDPIHTLNYMNNPVKNMTWGDWSDHEVVDTQHDSLVYDMPIGAGGLALCGQLHVQLNATTNCSDTDWVIEVQDHDPVTNTSMFLCHGMMRAAARDMGATLDYATPGKAHNYTFDSWPIGAYFAPGHSLRLVIRSSEYPDYAKNFNVMNTYFNSSWAVARNTIHHSIIAPSKITLPVITLP